MDELWDKIYNSVMKHSLKTTWKCDQTWIENVIENYFDSEAHGIYFP